MTATQPKKDYLLALKGNICEENICGTIRSVVLILNTVSVMRLTRPTLVSPEVIISESKDLPQNLFTQMVETDATAVKGSEQIAAGQFMLLPQSFGNIYLGETFSSYICVHNCTSHPVEEIRVTVRSSGHLMFKPFVNCLSRSGRFAI